jgi:8-oxo-dGTP diphosphatase
VIREFAEELGVDVSVADHFYTTDFYLPSAFNPEDQILSLYYRVALKNEDTKLLFPDGAPSDDEVMREAQVFRWYFPKQLTDGLLKLPADRVVASLIREAAEAS